MALYGLCPVFAVNAITLWKDIPFNLLLLVLMLKLAELAQRRGAWLAKKKNAALFLTLAVGICFTRGNGFALVCAICALVAVCWPRQWKRWLALFVPPLLCVALVRGPLYTALDIGRLGSVEAAAMPLQQVSRVVADDPGALTGAQREVIERFVPLEVIEQNHVPTSPDGIKKHPGFNSAAFGENLGPFLGVWLQLAPAHAESYLNSWLWQTMGYWKYDFESVPVYLSEDFSGSFGIDYKDMARWLTGLDFHSFFANRSGYPPMGLMAQAGLLAAALLAAQKRPRAVQALAPPLVVWLGLMAGAPTYNDFRYLLVYALALPVILWLPAAKDGAVRS
jgi:hypothetical protein